MSDRDNITLPREVVEGALEALDSEHPDIQLRAAIALRTALAAEQTKPEPVASDDDEEFTREDVTTLLLEVMDWTYAKAHRNRPMTEAEQKVLNDIRTHLAAEQPKPTDKDSLTVQSRLDAESFREERDEARALLNGVLQDIEALRRDAERYRYLRDKAYVWDSDMPKAMRPVALWLHADGNANIDAAIDAAMGDKT